jgi:cytosine permease
MSTVNEIGLELGHDDYAITRVPRNKRYGFLTMFFQWISMAGTMTQFLLGATLGVALSFWDALIAVTIGGMILEIFFLALGYAGLREGMGTSLLARWAGFGRKGSALVSLVLCITGVGWFGIQNQVFANSLSLMTGLQYPILWSLLAGVGLMILVIYGFKYMTVISFVAVPAFLGLLVYILVTELQTHSFMNVIQRPVTGAPMAMTTAITIVAGSKMLGVFGAADHTRYNKRMSHVVWQTVGHLGVGHYFTMMVGVWLAKAVGSASVPQIVMADSGLVGLVILLLGIVKVNDWNLYDASLGLTNFLEVIVGYRVHRGVVTAFLGAAGIVLSALGILSHFTGWLSLLGTAVSPLIAIIATEYVITRRFQGPLNATRDAEIMPQTAFHWVPATYVVWAVGFAVAYFATWGVPVVTALVVTTVLYIIADKTKLLRGMREDPITTSDVVAKSVPSVRSTTRGV